MRYWSGLCSIWVFNIAWCTGFAAYDTITLNAGWLRILFVCCLTAMSTFSGMQLGREIKRLKRARERIRETERTQHEWIP
jgi:hypothetical protein